MNATGIGNKFLVHAALALAIITSAAAAFNSLWLTPWALDKRAETMEQLSADNSVDLLQKGQFQRTPDGSAVIFIDDVKNKKLSDVFVAQIIPKDSLRPSVMIAESGVVKEMSDGRQVLSLFDGIRYEGLPNQLDYMNTEYQEYDALIGNRKIEEQGRDWEDLPTQDLMSNPDHSAQAELHWRISLIVCIPLLTLIVIPLSAVNPRQGRFAKMGPAILIYMAYFLAISASKSAIEDGAIPTVVGMWPVNAGLLLVGILLHLSDSIFIRRIKDSIRRKRVTQGV